MGLTPAATVTGMNERIEFPVVISVVISTFNRSGRLKKAIESVINQTYTDWELIIVDDNSPDDTEDVVKSFSNERIRYIKRTSNFGCDTRPKNDGIMMARGEYVAFLDDDNEFRPDHLKILMKEMEEKPWDVVYGDRWLIDETEKIQPQLGFCRDFDPALLMQRNFIDTSDVLVRREALYDVGGFDERYKKYIDWNLWVRLCKWGKRFKRVPMVITDYHLHSSMKSLTVKDRTPEGSAPVPLGSELVFKPEWDSIDLEIELPYLNNEVRFPKVAVFTITYDRLKYTKQSFKSLRKTAGYRYSHFVVDNGSTDGTREWLRANIDEDKLILNEKNMGISKASNQAVEMIKEAQKYDIVVKWDNDCIGLTKNWLAKMVEIWKSNHMISLSCYVQGLVDNPGGATRLVYGTVRNELIGITKHLGGICHFVDIKAYDKFKWDEDSFLHGVQDMEMSQHLVFSGYTLGYLENYFVSHGPSGTEGQKKDFPEYFERRNKERTINYEENRQPPDQH